MTNYTEQDTILCMFLAFAMMLPGKGIEISAAEFGAMYLELVLFLVMSVYIVKEFDNFKK